MIHQNWGTLIGQHFSFTKTNMPKVGDRVEGIVVANAPFGIWLDIGAGIPGMLFIPYLDDNTYSAKDYPDWIPEIKTKIFSKVVCLQEYPIPQISLQQVSFEEKRMQANKSNKCQQKSENV